MEVELAGSNRRLPCRALEKGETASVPSGMGMENWAPGKTASCVARRNRSNESIAARDVAHSVPYSCAGRTETTVNWRKRRTTMSANIVATEDATASESLRKGSGLEDYA